MDKSRGSEVGIRMFWFKDLPFMHGAANTLVVARSTPKIRAPWIWGCHWSWIKSSHPLWWNPRAWPHFSWLYYYYFYYNYIYVYIYIYIESIQLAGGYSPWIWARTATLYPGVNFSGAPGIPMVLFLPTLLTRTSGWPNFRRNEYIPFRNPFGPAWMGYAMSKTHLKPLGPSHGAIRCKTKTAWGKTIGTEL